MPTVPYDDPLNVISTSTNPGDGDPLQKPPEAQQPSIHDYQIEYRVRNITKERAQEILYALPEDIYGDLYVTDRLYEEATQTLYFTVYLDDVSITDISGFTDFMEESLPECKLQYDYMHDYSAAVGPDDNAEIHNALDLGKFEGYRTLP